MKGRVFKDSIVYLYQSTLFTKSPLLKNIYCESHRFEPWAVNGDPGQYGIYRFENVLTINRVERERLLSSILTQIVERPDYIASVRRRFDETTRRFIRRLVQVEDLSEERICGLLDDAARVLSIGVFKEVLEPSDAERFLSRFVPVKKLRTDLLALYQPLCLPHFIMYELKLHFFSEHYARDRRKVWIERCIDQCAYLSKFFLEKTRLDDPIAMALEMDRVIERFGGSPERIGKHRQALVANHREAIENSFLASQQIMAGLSEYGDYTLATKRLLLDFIHFIQYFSSFEELKHTLVLKAARILQRIMTELNLPIESTGRAELLAGLKRTG